MGQTGGGRDIRLRLARFPAPPESGSIPTGMTALDAALGGGLPRGRIVELFGPSSSGKTTVALRIVTSLQRNGGGAAWIDAERAFDPHYAEQIGVDVDRLAVVQPDCAEQALEIALRLAASGAVDLLVIDSAAALVPELELRTAIGGPGSGLQSRVMASGLRRLAFALNRYRAAALFLNQTRMVQLPDGPAERSAGGPPLKLHSAVRIALDGPRRFRIVKNKVTTAFSEGDLPSIVSPAFAKMR